MGKQDIETKLIDTPKLIAEIDSYCEWVNENDIMGNLIDESTVLAIANERVRERMLSISESVKFIRDKNESLTKRNYELELELKEANKKLDTLDEVAKQKAVEILKDVERELYTYAKGDKLFLIVERYHYEDKVCPVCDGTKKIIVKQTELRCPNCNYGKVSIKVIDPYEIREITIYSNSAKLTKHDDCGYDFEAGYACYSYISKKDKIERYDNLTNKDVVFNTKEGAEQWIKEQNK